MISAAVLCRCLSVGSLLRWWGKCSPGGRKKKKKKKKKKKRGCFLWNCGSVLIQQDVCFVDGGERNGVFCVLYSAHSWGPVIISCRLLRTVPNYYWKGKKIIYIFFLSSRYDMLL